MIPLVAIAMIVALLSFGYVTTVQPQQLKTVQFQHNTTALQTVVYMNALQTYRAQNPSFLGTVPFNSLTIPSPYVLASSNVAGWNNLITSSGLFIYTNGPTQTVSISTLKTAGIDPTQMGTVQNQVGQVAAGGTVPFPTNVTDGTIFLWIQ